MLRNVVPLNGTEARMSSLRSLLFVPGDRPSRIANAVSCGADAVAVDLEDAVAESAKEQARATAVATLLATDTSAVSLLVRVNAVGTAQLDDDVAALGPLLDRLTAVILPKAESADDVRHLSALLERAESDAGARLGSTRVLVTAETAAGVLSSRDLATASPRVLTLLFGCADLSSDLGVQPTPTGAELATARSMVVLAAAAARLPSPVDGPHLQLDDDEGLAASARTARQLGFGGKVVLHPAQVATVAGIFAPDPAELAWAAEVDRVFTEAERDGRSAVQLSDGTFVDYPVAHRARALLSAHPAGAGPS